MLATITLLAIFVEPSIVFYVVLSCHFILPPVLLACFGEQPSNPERDGEITEFLPEVTEDNLQVLNRAGEAGDSPTSSNSANGTSNAIDDLDDEELEDLKIPSHEELEDDDEDDEDSDDDKSVDLLNFKLQPTNESASKRHTSKSNNDDDFEIREISDEDDYSEEESESESDDEDEEEDDDDANVDNQAKVAKEFDKNSKHLDVERSDNSSDDDFEIINENELAELKNV